VNSRCVHLKWNTFRAILHKEINRILCRCLPIDRRKYILYHIKHIARPDKSQAVTVIAVRSRLVSQNTVTCLLAS